MLRGETGKDSRISGIAGLASAVALLLGVPGAAAAPLVYCAVAEPEGFDPAPYTLAPTFEASAQVLYDRLLTFQPGTTELAPALAESFDVSADGLEYTFRLRPDVQFHRTDSFTPTRSFNADDVIFSLGRQIDQTSAYYGYRGGVWPYAAGMSLGALIRDISRLDDQTVVFELRRPEAQFPSLLAMDFASVLSAEYAERLLADGTPDLLDRAPVGTGPFILSEATGEGIIRYRQNPDYWGGEPAIDGLVFDVSPDETVRRAKLELGDCQVGKIAAPVGEATFDYLETPGANVAYMAFNTTIGPFDQPDVRRAVNLAVDHGAIVDSIYGGHAVIASGPVPSVMWPGASAMPEAVHDPEAAKQILSELGVLEGTQLNLWVLDRPLPYNPDPAGTAAMIRDDLADVGIDVELLVIEDATEFLSVTADTTRDGAVLFGWSSDNGDPANILEPLLTCDSVGIANRAQWCEAAFDQTIARIAESVEPAERDAAIGEALALFGAGVPWLPIAHVNTGVAVAKGVEGVSIDPFGRVQFSARN